MTYCVWCADGVDCPRHPKTGNEEAIPVAAQTTRRKLSIRHRLREIAKGKLDPDVEAEAMVSEIAALVDRARHHERRSWRTSGEQYSELWVVWDGDDGFRAFSARDHAEVFLSTFTPKKRERMRIRGPYVECAPARCVECGGRGEVEDDATGALGYVVKRPCASCHGRCDLPHNGYTFETSITGTRKIALYADGKVVHTCEHVYGMVDDSAFERWCAEVNEARALVGNPPLTVDEFRQLWSRPRG